MQDHVYAVTEIVGSSREPLADAIRNAIRTGAKALRQLEWFEVSQIRGHIEDNHRADCAGHARGPG